MALKTRPIEIGGYTIVAPGFTSESVDRAMFKAYDEQLDIRATVEPGTFVVSSGTMPGLYYLTTRTTCTCKAGQYGLGCKHRALVIMELDMRSDSGVAAAA